MRKASRKKIAVICCAGLLAVAGAGMALAQSPTLLAGGGKTEAVGGPGAGMEEAVMDKILVWGEVIRVDENGISINNQSGNSMEGEIVIHVAEGATLVLDGENGFPVSLSEIQAGETVYAYIGPAMTMSLPPQTTAEMILCKVPADAKVPEYVVADTMEWQENGDWILTGKNGTVYQIPGNCPIIPYLTRNLVTLQDVTQGRELLVWSDAQNQGQKLVLFAEDVQ